MRLAALFSGGKDSTYAVHSAEKMGHRVDYLLVVYPASDQSLYFHYPNIWLTRLQAEAMAKKYLAEEAGADELEALRRLLGRVAGEVEGVVTGAVASTFQLNAFGRLCGEFGLKTLAPLWGRNPTRLLREIISAGFEVMVTVVAAEGLGPRWLGAIIDEERMRELEELKRRLGVNPVGEGGELETLVLNCPLFRKRLEIRDYEVRWMGDRGILVVRDVRLVEKP